LKQQNQSDLHRTTREIAMNVPADVIQQLVADAVASQDNEAVGVVVIVVGKDSLSVGGVGATPSLDDVSHAMSSFVLRDMPSTLLH
jgi:hypothetical protein